MSNTSSNKTSKTNKRTVKVIVGEIGRDTKTGILGRGYSYDNGATFHVTDTMFGRLYDKDDGERMWPNMAHKVADEIKSATADLPNVRKQADEAVKFAESAIAASKVNSDAIVAQSEAISEAKSAMDSATAEIQQLKANAASDVAQIRADVAQVQNEVDTAKAANSASVDKLKSDIGLAQKDLDNVHDSLTKAQSAVEQNQKLINDSVTKINSDIAQSRQDIVTAQQANNDLAKQLDTYSKEAQEQGKTIKTIQDNQDGFSITIADVKGDVTKVSDTVDGLSAGLKDAQGNIASVKAQADQLNATLTDHSKDIAQLTATAKELSSTLEDADGRLSKVEQTASEQSTTLSDLQGNLTQVKQTADNLVTTLKDAQGNIDQIKQDAKGTLEQLSNAQGDITALQKDVSGIKLTIADHDKNIHTLQADSKTLKDDMADAKGNISSLQKTSTSLTSEMQDHSGRLSKVEQTASKLINDFSDQQGHLNRVEQTAQGTQQTVANQQGQINIIRTDASGIHETLTGQGNQIATINVTLNSLKSQYEGVSGDLNKLKNGNQWKIVTGDFDANQYTQTARIFYQDTQAKNTPNPGWFYLLVEAPRTDRITQNLIKDKSDDSWSRFYDGEWSAWTKGVTNLDVTSLSDRVTTNSTQITQNKKEIDLKANQDTVDNLTGEVSQTKAQLKVQADQISSKVSSSDFKTLNDKFNNMQIGGRNLLTNTDKDISVTSHTTDGWPAWASIDTGFSFEHGKTYTFSAEAKNSTNKIAEASIRVFEGSTDTQVGIYAFPADGKRHSVTFIIPNDSHDYHLLLYAGHAGIVPGVDVTTTYHHPKLEFGNVATDWSPAPEDTITAIQKNSTAIDQTNKQISLKANQTEVDKIKNTATQNSSRLDVMANEIQSKVTSTDVNNIVDGKGYATTSTVQSLITQKAGTINESITNLDAKYRNINGVNLVHNSGFHNVTIDELKNSGWYINDGIWINKAGGPNKNGSIVLDYRNGTQGTTLGMEQTLQLEPDTDYTLSLHVLFAEMAAGKSFDAWTYFVEHDASGRNVNPYVDNGHPMANSYDRNKNTRTFHTTKNTHSGILCLRANPGTKVELEEVKLERGKVESNTAWTPAPSDNATVTQIQSITASIDGLQSNVTNLKNDTSSRITQLSNTFQSKIGDAQIAINDLKDKTLWKITDSVDLNNVVTQQKIFVKGGSNLPPGGYWWYVQVEPGYDSRIVQYAVSDRDNLHYSRQYDGSKWSAWSQGATESEITQLRDDINLRVKSGDLLSQINLTAGNTLIQSNKLYLDASSVVFSGRAFIPSAAISELDADKLTFYGNGSKASIGAGIAQYDQDKIKSTINLQYQGGFEIHSSNQLGSILTMHDDTVRLASRSQTFSAGSGKPLDQQYSGFWAGSNHALINAVDSEGKTTGWSIGPSNSNGYRAYLYDSSTSVQPNFGVGIGTQRFDVYAGGAGLYLGPDKAELRDKSYTTIHSDTETFIEGGNQQIYMHNGEVNIGNPNDTGNATGVHLRVFGWASFNGYVEGMGWTTKSTLSSKTRIEKLDTKDALNKIMETDLETYQYKAEVAGGMTKRHAGPIIDDVHDVAQYSTPDEFINERRTGRSDADVIGYLMGAVQELKKQLDEMKKEVQING